MPLPADRCRRTPASSRLRLGSEPRGLSVLAVAVCAATALQGSIGFGAGLVAAPVIALVAPELLPALVVMLACLVTLLVTVRERAHLDLKGAGWALAGRIPGSVLGAWLAVAMSTAALSWLVAGCVLAGVGSAFLGWRPVPNRDNLVAAGGLSGVMGTATADRRRPDGSRLARSAARTAARHHERVLPGRFRGFGEPAGGSRRRHQRHRGGFLWLAPVVLVGFLVSRWLNRFLDARRLRLVALLASARRGGPADHPAGLRRLSSGSAAGAGSRPVCRASGQLPVGPAPGSAAGCPAATRLTFPAMSSARRSNVVRAWPE